MEKRNSTIASIPNSPKRFLAFIYDVYNEIGHRFFGIRVSQLLCRLALTQSRDVRAVEKFRYLFIFEVKTSVSSGRT